MTEDFEVNDTGTMNVLEQQAKRIEDLEASLALANTLLAVGDYCPECGDRSGATQVGPDDWVQCRWCHERDYLAALNQGERDNE